MTKILKCTCDYPYQDQKYGKGMRVHNSTKSPNATTKIFRCTVCTKTQSQ